jgi:hypothetical protein
MCLSYKDLNCHTSAAGRCPIARRRPIQSGRPRLDRAGHESEPLDRDPADGIHAYPFALRLNLSRPSSIQFTILDPREVRVGSVGSRFNGWELRVPFRVIDLIWAIRWRSKGSDLEIPLQPFLFAKEPLPFWGINPRSTLSSKVFAVKSCFTRLDPWAFQLLNPPSMPWVLAC